MRIVVFSDSHGKLDWMIAIMEHEQPSCVFFLGDHERDGWDLSRLYPNTPLYAVKGNCDWGTGAEEWLVEVDGKRFLLTHGHLYGAKTGLDRLVAAGQRVAADMVCFGHTHRPLCEREVEGVKLFNPGTIGGPNGQTVTYGLLTISKGIIKEEIKGTDQV